MNLFYQPRLQEGVTFLDGDEAHHALRVLRIRKGDELMVTDGKGVLANAIFTDAANFTITKQVASPVKRFSINLFVAPTKNADRMEWLIEKATEIGVDSITLIECARSERRKISHERLVKMAVSAMKQSQQSWLPEVKPLVSFEAIIKTKHSQSFIAHVDHANPDNLKDLATPGKTYGLLIGPEGDFTDDEIKLAMTNGWQKVSLGTTRLRTETAAIVGCLTLVLANN
ncbi:MAG TPA: RsmE family RNA methyltransferase [Cyclobacteriaceae bacterium]|nr:RsmE family RNA methyltransferase [Cyclobacteriaceae bacterium]